MFNPANWSLTLSTVVFVVSALAIAVAGSRLAEIADRLSDVTGMGEAISGAIFLGAATSLPGIITSVTTAARGYPELAVSNALGGIAAQTMFIAAADVAYRKANLEHAAASITNILQGTLLIALLSFPLLAMTTPAISFFGAHPISPLMIVAYMYGLRIARQVRAEPMWQPRRTTQTRTDEPDEEQAGGQKLVRMWLMFALLAAVVGVAGWVVGRSGEVITTSTGISQTVVGGLFTAVATSLPELVTSIAAVRRGALTLAVSGIIGGNAFDTLFVAAADFAYRDGSIYHAITQRQVFLVALTILLTGILIMGLLRRQERGIGNIGFEGAAILFFYFSGFAILFVNS